MQVSSKFKESLSELNMEKNGARASSSGADIVGTSNKNTLNSTPRYFRRELYILVSFEPSI